MNEDKCVYLDGDDNSALICGGGGLLEIYKVMKKTPTEWIATDKIISSRKILGSHRSGLPSQQEEYNLWVENVDMGEPFQCFLDEYVPPTTGADVSQCFVYIYYYGASTNVRRVLVGYGQLNSTSGSSSTSSKTLQRGDVHIDSIKVEDGVKLTIDKSKFDKDKVHGVDIVLSDEFKTQYGTLVPLPRTK